MDFPCFGAKKKDGLGEVAGGGRDLIKARHGNKMLKSSLAPRVREPLNTSWLRLNVDFPLLGGRLYRGRKVSGAKSWNILLRTFVFYRFCEFL